MSAIDPTFLAAGVAAVCLVLWLTERVPVFVPTLLLLAALPFCGYSIGEGLGWMADPVLVLFFGSFVLGDACGLHGIDSLLVGTSTQLARGRAWVLLLIVMAATAFLSMWMSNVAAPALMLASLRPVLAAVPENVRRAFLVAIALAANLGGMATPIGTGPNAVAMAAMSPEPTFIAWMAFALPLTVGLLAVAYVLIAWRHHIGFSLQTDAPKMALLLPSQRPRTVGLVAAAAVVLWLTEPLHGISAAAVSVGVAAVLFSTNLVPRERLGALDWSTLLLIAGGLGVGRLLENAGWIERLSALLLSFDAPPMVLLAAVLLTTAVLSAIMSNTATATLLVPMAAALFPSQPSVVILVALAASVGMPFVISTPANAMAVGAGAESKDLMIPGLLLMGLGCACLVFTGPAILALFGY